MENERLRAARERAGLSLQGLAELAGIHQATLWELEMRAVSPNLRTARSIARALSEVLGKRLGVDDLFPEEAA